MDFSKYAIEFGGKNDKRPIEFIKVFHCTHVPEAKQIINAGIIRPYLTNEQDLLGLVQDVIWFGANDWVDGTQYGSVNFSFKIDHLIENNFLYWISPTIYRHTLCKILVTTKKLDLPEYNPYEVEGPWVIRDGKHYYNMKYVLAFLIDGSWDLCFSKGISFSKHHSKHCIKNDRRCPEIKMERYEVASHFIFWLASIGKVNLPYLHFSQEFKNQKIVTKEVNIAINRGIKEIREGLKYYDFKLSDEKLSSISRSIIALYGMFNDDLACDLAELFPSEPILREELLSHFIQDFNLQDGNSFVKKVHEENDIEDS